MMIIAMHSPIPNTGIDPYILSTNSLLTAPGIGLFVMVSGALLLPVNMPTKQFLQRRFKKIVGPILFWTLISMLVYVPNDVILSSHIWKGVLSIPIQAQFSSTLWFMYMLAGLYLLAPILSAWLRNATKRECLFYLCLWLVTLCYPLVRNILIVNESYSGILYYFGGYAGYFLLGYYLRFYLNTESMWRCSLFIGGPLFVAATIKLIGLQIIFYDLFWYLSFFVAMMSMGWFLLIKKTSVISDESSRIYHYVALISNCCFGIYLVHIFIMRSVVWHWSWLYDMGIMQIILVTILTFIGSLVVTWLISYLPGAEYIIGFKQKR